MSISAFTAKKYRCPRGHAFDGTPHAPPGLLFDFPAFKAGPFCPKCLADWIESNVPVLEEVKEPE